MFQSFQATSVCMEIKTRYSRAQIVCYRTQDGKPEAETSTSSILPAQSKHQPRMENVGFK